MEISAEDEQKIQNAIQSFEQTQMIQEQIFDLADFCFSKCITNVRDGLDKNDKVCVVNCVDRFIDATDIVLKTFPGLNNN
jgi:hypothetical protein